MFAPVPGFSRVMKDVSALLCFSRLTEGRNLAVTDQGLEPVSAAEKSRPHLEVYRGILVGPLRFALRGPRPAP
jgi:hypothetical protein